MIDLFGAFERVLEILEGKLADPEPPRPDAFERWIATYGLTSLEVDLLLLALLPEVDSAFCATFAEIQGTLGQPRPTVALATDVLSPGAHRMDMRRELLAGPLWSAGFLAVAPEHPFFEQPLLPGPGLLFGSEELVPSAIGETSLAIEEVTERSAQHVASEVSRLKQWTDVVRRPVVIVRDRGGVALAAGMSPRRRVLRAWGKLDTAALEQLCILACANEATLMLEVSGDTRLSLPAAARWNVPIFVTGEPAELRGDAAVQRSQVPRLTPAAALETWREALGEDTGADLYALAAQTHLSPDQIWSIAQVARNDDGRDVGPILRTIAGEPRSPLATTLEPRASFEDLIASPRCRSELDRIVDAVRLRTEVEVEGELPPNVRHLGNVVALFHGDSGTGKTLAAEALAKRLEMPLMVVDVSRVTSKYVGETEERLEALFQEAEGFRALLFLDEADSFFGSRTEISDANDRYANLETNYLLQRIEQFEGLVVLATNLRKNIDDAFTRRFRFVVPFDKPGAHEQLAIWERHLPATAIDPERLAHLSRALQLVGGDIRKIAVSAIFDAAAVDVPLDFPRVTDAIGKELARAGRRVPDQLNERS